MIPGKSTTVRSGTDGAEISMTMVAVENSDEVSETSQFVRLVILSPISSGLERSVMFSTAVVRRI
jgi:hypothetical protein